METTETTTEAVEKDQNVALTAVTYGAAIMLIAAAGYKVGNVVRDRLAARKAAKEAPKTETPEED